MKKQRFYLVVRLDYDPSEDRRSPYFEQNGPDPLTSEEVQRLMQNDFDASPDYQAHGATFKVLGAVESED